MATQMICNIYETVHDLETHSRVAFLEPTNRIPIEPLYEATNLTLLTYLAGGVVRNIASTDGLIRHLNSAIAIGAINPNHALSNFMALTLKEIMHTHAVLQIAVEDKNFDLEYNYVPTQPALISALERSGYPRDRVDAVLEQAG